MNRNTTIRDKHRAIIAKDKPPCGICGGEIDYEAPHLDPGEFTVDHIVPLSITGPAGDVLENKQAAHRHCNRQSGAKLKVDYAPTETRVTKRQWWTS